VKARRPLATLLAAVLVLQLVGCAYRTPISVLHRSPGQILAWYPRRHLGALTVPSEDKVERNEAMLERALADASLPDALTFWIMEAGGHRPIFFGGDPDGPAVVTLLALDAPQVSLTSRDPTVWRPGLRLRVSTRAPPLRASDGLELGAWFWEHEGLKATFFEWDANDAKLQRQELERASRALAAQVIRDVY